MSRMFGASLEGPILVTGHTGFKGTWLTLLLESLNLPIVGLSLEPHEDSLYLRLNRKGKIFEEFIDVRDLDGVGDFLRRYRPSAIIHMAAQPLVFAAILLGSSLGTAPTLYKGLLLLGLIGLPFYLHHMQTSCIRAGADGHLEWNIAPFGELSAFGELSTPVTTHTLFTLYYYGAILLCTVTMHDPFLAASFSAMFVVSFWLIRDRYPRSWGSVWCHAINAIAILSLLT